MIALVLAVGATAPSAADEPYSQNCPKTTESKLSDDTYLGTFEVRVTATGKLLNRIELAMTGSFEMRRESGDIMELTGKINFSLKTYSSSFLKPSLTSEAFGTLERTGLTTAGDRFQMAGELKGSAMIGTKDTVLNLGVGGVADFLEFLVVTAGCDAADGQVKSRALDEARTKLLALGDYQVSELSGYWSATTGTKLGDEQRKLKEDLDRVMNAGGSSGALVRTRGTMANSAAHIADRIRSKFGATPMLGCLLEQYRDHVARYFRTWLEEDVAALSVLTSRLAKTTADGGAQQMNALNELVIKALESDRSLALFGVDTCYAKLHADLWSQVEVSLDAMLTHLVKSGAPAADLFRVLRMAELLGEITPALRERVYATVRARAFALFDELRKSFEHMRAVNGASCDSGIMSAFLVTVGAGNQCQILGGDCEFPTAADHLWLLECQAAAKQATAKGDK